jgi:two-component system phosphate regulon sensor histidine kinase PhoR
MDVEVDALTQMVEELLELARIESGRIPIRLRPVPLIDVVLPSVERLQPQAERAALAIDVDLEADSVSVLADAERVQQVVTNLVHNAIKFTPAGGQIRVCGRAFHNAQGRHDLLGPGNWFVLAVEDNGVGIDPDDLSRIFERFYKADRARSGGGTGLGLAIAKHVVQGHGGQIWAESPATGPFWEDRPESKSVPDPRRRGSTFYVALALASSD